MFQIYASNHFSILFINLNVLRVVMKMHSKVGRIITIKAFYYHKCVFILYGTS